MGPLFAGATLAGTAAAAGSAFSSIMPVLSLASTGISVFARLQGQRQQQAAAAQQVAAMRAQAQAQQVAAEHRAKQFEANALLERAAAKQQSEATKLRGARLASAAVANAVAGGLVPDPTVLANLAEETFVQRAFNDFGGGTLAAGQQAQADAARFSGASAVANAPTYVPQSTGLSTLSTIASGFFSNPLVTAGIQGYGSSNLRFAPSTGSYA